MCFYLVIISIVSVLFITFSVVRVMSRIRLILVINVRFFSGIFTLFSVVSNIINDTLGTLVIFFEVIISVSIRMIFC